jgi:hypothetical protein
VPDHRESGGRPSEAQHLIDPFIKLRCRACNASGPRHLIVELMTPRAIENEASLLLAVGQ